MAAVNALHGRYFAGKSSYHATAVLCCAEDQSECGSDVSLVVSGKMIKAAYVPLPTYHNLFPDAATATQLLAPPPRR